MTTFISKEVQAGLDAARKEALKTHSRLRVMDGDEVYPVLRMWDGGFSLEAEAAPKLRGLVDLFDGARHLYQCLIIASQEENGEMQFDFKRNTAVLDRAPLDFVRDEKAPVALLT
jgi:hypothetical protein